MPRIILAAGMVRTGSTWQYNVIRCACLRAGLRTYGVYADDYRPETEADVHVVKVHTYDDDLRQRAERILTMRRDLRDVAASMVRKGWVLPEPEPLLAYLRQTLPVQYDAWRPWAHHETDYADIRDRAVEEVSGMLECLQVSEVSAPVVLHDVEMLGRTVWHDANPVTQLWPTHITDGGTGTYGRTLSAACVAAVEALMQERGEARETP